MAPTAVTRNDALAGILVGAMRADGREHATEHTVLFRHLAGRCPHGSLRWVALVEDLARRREQVGAPAFLGECVGALPADQRGRALLGTLEVILADARISAEELEYFLLLSDLVYGPGWNPMTREAGGLEVPLSEGLRVLGRGSEAFWLRRENPG